MADRSSDSWAKFGYLTSATVPSLTLGASVRLACGSARALIWPPSRSMQRLARVRLAQLLPGTRSRRVHRRRTAFRAGRWLVCRPEKWAKLFGAQTTRWCRPRLLWLPDLVPGPFHPAAEQTKSPLSRRSLSRAGRHPRGVPPGTPVQVRTSRSATLRRSDRRVRRLSARVDRATQGG